MYYNVYCKQCVYKLKFMKRGKIMKKYTEREQYASIHRKGARSIRCKKYILYIFTFSISVCLAVLAFNTAYTFRGYGALGGEVFTIALPISILTDWVVQIWKSHKRKKFRLYQN